MPWRRGITTMWGTMTGSVPRGAAQAATTVADAMHWGLVHCAPDTSLREVAALMAAERVHCVVVIEDPDDRQSLWGIVTDLDLVAASTVRPLDDQRAGGT